MNTPESLPRDVTHEGVGRQQDTSSIEERVNRAPSLTGLDFDTRIHNFTWAWYLPVMGTGGMAIQLHLIPFRFRGLDTLGIIIFMMSLFFFVLTTVCLAVRFFSWRHSFRNSILHPNEGLFSATFLLAFATILINTCNYGVPKIGGGKGDNWLSATMEVIFWIYTMFAVLLGIGLPFIIISRESHSPQATSPAWALPTFPAMLVGSVAAAVVPISDAQHALPIILAGILMQGFGILISLMFITLFLYRLMLFRFPPPNLRPAIFMEAGPPGFTAFALIALGRDAKTAFMNTEIDGNAFSAATILAGMCLWGLAGWWMLLAITAVISGSFSKGKRRSEFQFHLSWWAFLFPNTGFIATTISLGTIFHSRGVHIFGTILVAIEILIWIFLLIRTPWAVYKGRIVVPGKDENAPLEGFKPVAEEKRSV